VFCKRLTVVSLASVFLILLSACQRQPARPVLERIAILRFENLGSDPSQDWMGRAFAEIISSELTGARRIYAIPGVRIHVLAAELGGRPAGAPGVSAERTPALLAAATKIVYGQYAVRGGTLEVRVSVEDVLAGKMTELNPVSAPPTDIVSVASALASQISPQITPYGTGNPQVVEAYVNALEGIRNQNVAQQLEGAIAADPNFGPPYRQLAQLKAQQRDTDGAQEVIHQALARGNAMPAGERARLQLEDAMLRNDTAARVAALAALADADSYNPETWHELGVTSMATHRYLEAVQAFRKAAEIQPDNGDFWNQLGYAAASAGDAATATTAIEMYRKLAPNSPNPIDSLGDVNLIAGRLHEAEESYRQAAKQYPEFFSGLDYLKAALARLMTGDVAGADGLAKQYFDARVAAKDPALEYRKAQWAWISGRRKAACAQLDQVARASETAAATRNLASHAYTELAVWTLMLGNRQSASEFAQKATALAAPASGTEANLVRFLSQTRAGAPVPEVAQSPIGNLALADAHLFAKEFTDALPLLQSMYDDGNAAAGEGLPVLLAWADVETGHTEEAAALLRTNPSLSDVGLTWSTPLYFPRIFYLRAVVAEKQGKADEARENWRIFHALSGSDPLMWGEEQKGR